MLSLNSISVVHEVATQIEGDPQAPDLTLEVREPVVGTAVVRPGRDFTELQFTVNAATWLGGSVTIERPSIQFNGSLRGARVSWSSSPSSTSRLEDAAVTAKLLEVAVQVAAQLDRWASAGLSQRINDEQMAATRPERES